MVVARVVVPHVGLDVGDRPDLHGQRAERVAQVVEAQIAQAGTGTGRLEAAIERRTVDWASHRAAEDEVIERGEVLTAGALVERPCHPVDERRAPDGGSARESHSGAERDRPGK